VSGEVPQVVGPELGLEPVLRQLPRRRHHAGVVDQQIQAVVLGSEPGGELADRRQIGEVEQLQRDLALGDLGTDALDGLLALAGFRAATITVAWWRQSSAAVGRPMPELAPVTTATRPA